jgi:ribosome-binding factor A
LGFAFFYFCSKTMGHKRLQMAMAAKEKNVPVTVSGPSRAERVGKLVRAEISALLLKGIKDPRIGLATVTDVEMSPDLRQARVFVSIYGDQAVKQETLKGLNEATGFIRHQLGRHLSLRFVPALTFIFDPSIEEGARMDRLLRSLESGQQQDGRLELLDEPVVPVKGPRDFTPVATAPELTTKHSKRPMGQRRGHGKHKRPSR